MNQFEHVQVAGQGPCIERGLGPRPCTGRDLPLHDRSIRLKTLPSRNIAVAFICRVFSSLRMDDQGPRLTLNVGGTRFEITSATLSNVPDGAGKLANLKRLLQTEEPCSAEYILTGTQKPLKPSLTIVDLDFFTHHWFVFLIFIQK